MLLNRAIQNYGCLQRFIGVVSSTRANISTNPRVASLHTLTQCHPQQCHANSLGFQKANISTTAPRSVVGWMQEKLAERAQNKKAAKLVDQIALMANSPTWTLKMFADEIDETLSSWSTKIPGASNTAEIQTAKETQKVVKAMLDNLGEQVTAKDISKLDRKQKLKLAIACKKPMDEVNTVLNSFSQMEIMHRILRYRKENGIPLPSDEAGLKMAMQKDGMKVMTNQEKQEMREAYAKYSGRKA